MKSLIFFTSLGVMFGLYAVFNHQHIGNDVSLKTKSEQQVSTTEPVINSQEKIDNFPIVTLPTPPFKQDAPINIQSQASIDLELISSSANNITDTELWFAENQLSLPTYEVANPFQQEFGNVPEVIPTKYKNNILIKAIRSERTNLVFLIYDMNFNDGRYLFAFNTKTNKIEYGYDFSNYLEAPEYERADREFIAQNIIWVRQIGEILYISHSHSTYAKSSLGMNAYITAIDTKTDRILWRSQPLVANSNNFVIRDNVIISGYGFTAEPDYIYLLSIDTGEVLQQIPVKSAPQYLILENNKLYVRTYNTDYIYQIDN